jgi:hypothetical protein
MIVVLMVICVRLLYLACWLVCLMDDGASETWDACVRPGAGGDA